MDAIQMLILFSVGKPNPLGAKSAWLVQEELSLLTSIGSVGERES